MSCLFGYVGRPHPQLLARMAGRLSHRCRGGWERVGLGIESGWTAEIGRGRAGRDEAPTVASAGVELEGRTILGYAGVIFNADAVVDCCPPTPEDLARTLGESPSGIDRLDGAFVGALVRRRSVFLFRDPAGIKVLYWTRTRDRLIFASEIKALFADPAVERTLRVGAIPEYLTFSFIPGERTAFEEIHELAPGSMIQFRNGDVHPRRYFTFEDRADDDPEGRISDADHVARTRSALYQSVAEACAVAKDPPAVFLSGGIDSSAVLAHAAQLYPDHRLKTFSIHFGREFANENEYVGMMVESRGTDHTWLEIRPRRFLDRMREIIYRLDDPIGDPITVPNYLMAEAASAEAQVVLNGEGGDPCFGGPKNIPMMLARIYGPPPGEPPDGYLERCYLHTYRKCFTDLDQLLVPEVRQAAGGDAALVDILTPFFHADRPRHFLNRLMSANIRLKGANLILVKVEKMTAANGLLALAPLFSRRTIETSMACPPRLKLMGNVEKGILKRAVAGVVPNPIIDRPKSGMMVPVRFWLQGEMRRYAQRVLSRRRLRQLGYFNVDYVRKLLDYDRTEVGSARHGLKLWMLITFVLWHETMVEGK